MTSDLRTLVSTSPFSKLNLHPLAPKANPSVADAVRMTSAAPAPNSILNPLDTAPEHDDPDVPELGIEDDFGPGVEAPFDEIGDANDVADDVDADSDTVSVFSDDVADDADTALDTLLENFDNAATTALIAGAMADEGGRYTSVDVSDEDANADTVASKVIAEAPASAVAADSEPATAAEAEPITETEEPIVPGFANEFLSDVAVAQMADRLRVLNDEKLRSSLMAVLPLIFGAKSVTAENDVAIYVAENALFREWLMAFYKVAGIEIAPISRSSVNLMDEKLFLSRAPTLFDMRMAAMELLSLIKKWQENDVKSGETATLLKTAQGQLLAARASATENERARQNLENQVTRMTRDLGKVAPLAACRIQWTVTGKTQTGQVAQRTAYLALRDTDTGTMREDGVWPTKHYVVTYKEDAAEIFSDIEVAFRTLEFVKNQSRRLRESNGGFDPKFMPSAVVVQWATVTHTVRPNTPKAAG